MSDRYTVISADCHAGGNMAMYEQYLPSAWRDEYDEWRGAYRNPYRDLQDDGRSRNWDDDRRIAEQCADGIVAEITFPNTVPPFYPTGALPARSPRNDLVITHHGGNGAPDYGKDPASGVIFLMEVPFFAHRNLAHLILSGVFERFESLRYVMTEQGVAWAVEELRCMDGYHAQMRRGRVGELGFAADVVLPHKPSEYFDRNVWIGAGFPSPGEAEAIRKLGVHKVMWGSDYPHHEGTYPFSTAALQRAFSDWPEAVLRKVLAENAAGVYGFDLDRPASIAAEHGPTVDDVATPLRATPKGATSPAFSKA